MKRAKLRFEANTRRETFDIRNKTRLNYQKENYKTYTDGKQAILEAL
jgi:hypothetical protein